MGSSGGGAPRIFKMQVEDTVHPTFLFRAGVRGHALSLSLSLSHTPRYLVVIFYKSGSFTIAQVHIAKPANKAVQALRRNFRNECIRVDVIMQLIDSVVLPILAYGLTHGTPTENS